MQPTTPIRDEKGRVICGARTRKRDEHGNPIPCRNAPVEGRTRCRMHGGTQPVGIASPNYKHGRYSEAMPRRLNDTYERVRTDPDILNLSEQFYLLETRLQDTLKRSDLGEAGRLWLETRKQWGAFKRARDSGDVPGMTDAIAMLDRLIGKGAGEAAAWGEIADLIERQRRVVETESRRREKMHEMVTTDRLQLLLTRLTNVIRETVHEPEARRALAAEIRNIVGPGRGE